MNNLGKNDFKLEPKLAVSEFGEKFKMKTINNENILCFALVST